MKTFEIYSYERIGAGIDKYVYDLCITNCRLELTATINAENGYVLLDILQKTGFVKTEEMKIVFDAIFKFLDESFVAGISKEEGFYLFLDPAGDDHYFNQKLNEEGIMHFYNENFLTEPPINESIFNEVIYFNINADDELF